MDTHITVQEELLRFARAGLLGIGCGVLFDILRLLRTLLPHGAIAVFLEDTLFSFLFCFILQIDAWSFCGGALRFSQFLGMTLGLALYLLTIGLVTRRMFIRLRQFRNRIYQGMLRLLHRKSRKTGKFSENT